MNNSGSPIAARLGLNIFAVLIIALIILAALAVLWFISKKLEALKNSQAYLEKNKDKPTSAKDINEASKHAHLTKEERDILTKIFKQHISPNLFFVLKDTQLLESYFNEEYQNIFITGDQQAITSFFSLRQKLYSSYEAVTSIKNSRLIPVETVFTYTPSQGIHYQFKLYDTNQEELHFLLPLELKPEEKPEILSKINLVFVYKDSAPFELEARVIRYQKNKENRDILVCAHSDRIMSRKKRSAPRIDFNHACTFASVKTQTNGNSTSYTVSDKRHDGIITDSSAGGCRVITKLPIKPEQYIHINAPFDGKENDQAIGMILRTTKNKNEEYILHIKFVKIRSELQNKINAVACGYQK